MYFILCILRTNIFNKFVINSGNKKVGRKISVPLEITELFSVVSVSFLDEVVNSLLVLSNALCPCSSSAAC